MWAIRRTNKPKGMSSRTPVPRPFISCGSPGSRPDPALYITHALHANNAAPNEAFQNIIGDAQPEGLLWPNFVLLSRKSLACYSFFSCFSHFAFQRMPPK